MYPFHYLDCKVGNLKTAEIKMTSDMNNETRAVPIYSENSPVRLMTEEEIRKEKTNSILPQDTISNMLKERGSRYGNFGTHALITQDLKKVLDRNGNYAIMPPYMKECIDMIFHKIGRIVNGNPYYEDSWVDIIGYTQLVLDLIKENKKEI